MMTDNQIKEKVKLNTEIFKAFFAVAILTVGGTVSLINTELQNATQFTLVSIGAIASFGFSYLALFTFRQTNNLINKL